MANPDRVRLLGLIRQDAVENCPPERWPFTVTPPDLRSLTRDAVYAIPVELLARIDGDLPNWLFPAELAQERRVAELCAGRTPRACFWGSLSVTIFYCTIQCPARRSCAACSMRRRILPIARFRKIRERTPPAPQ